MSASRRSSGDISRAAVGPLRLNRRQRHRLVHPKRSRPRPPQRVEVSAAPEPLAEVVRERPDVEAGARHTTRRRAETRVRNREQRELVDRHLTGLQLDGRLPARVLVRRAPRRPSSPNRVAASAGTCRGMPIERSLDSPDATRPSTFGAASRIEPLGIVGVGRDAQADVGKVLLVVADEELREAGGLADEQDEEAGRERIERAGVADARRHQRAARTRHDIVGRRARRFVDEERAVQ